MIYTPKTLSTCVSLVFGCLSKTWVHFFLSNYTIFCFGKDNTWKKNCNNSSLFSSGLFICICKASFSPYGKNVMSCRVYCSGLPLTRFPLAL